MPQNRRIEDAISFLRSDFFIFNSKLPSFKITQEDWVIIKVFSNCEIFSNKELFEKIVDDFSPTVIKHIDSGIYNNRPIIYLLYYLATFDKSTLETMFPFKPTQLCPIFSQLKYQNNPTPSV